LLQVTLIEKIEMWCLGWSWWCCWLLVDFTSHLHVDFIVQQRREQNRGRMERDLLPLLCVMCK
jgi:hypothetical protein